MYIHVTVPAAASIQTQNGVVVLARLDPGHQGNLLWGVSKVKGHSCWLFTFRGDGHYG